MEEEAGGTTQPAGQKPTNRRLRRRRFRMAGERLTEDESLRDALSDEQAQQLLDWGLAYVEAEVDSTLDLEDEQAAGRLDARVSAVRKVMRQVNQMVDGWETGDPAGRWQELLELSQVLRPLQPPAGGLESTPQLFSLGQSNTPLDKDALFTELMTILKEDAEKR